MDNSFVIIAYGANEMAVPCLFSNNKEQLKGILTETFPEGEWSDENCVTIFKYLDGDSLPKEISEKFFTYYYDFCGGVYKFKIVTITPGKPFVRWDLD